MESKVTDLLKKLKDCHKISDQQYLTVLTRISSSHDKAQNPHGKVTS